MHILITTDYLVPCDEVDRLLRKRGHHTTHSPARGTRPAGELASLLADADAGLVASEPISAQMLRAAYGLRLKTFTPAEFRCLAIQLVHVHRTANVAIPRTEMLQPELAALSRTVEWC